MMPCLTRAGIPLTFDLVLESRKCGTMTHEIKLECKSISASYTNLLSGSDI